MTCPYLASVAIYMAKYAVGGDVGVTRLSLREAQYEVLHLPPQLLDYYPKKHLANAFMVSYNMSPWQCTRRYFVQVFFLLL